ncbi:MAG: 2-keto-3-deoxy-L-rhamnonate aldolase [Saprospiraceae bacterium]|nr:2-keto-3-deoxy-L-rhamnonate aldolase [Saprospiraceae bacterium]
MALKLGENRLKHRIHDGGEVLLGLFNGLRGPYATEICAGAGFDWICIDGEHAPFDLPLVVQQHQIMSAYPSSLLVRTPDHDVTRIKQLLDAGVQSLLVPMVESIQTVEAIVEVLDYGPKGRRGVGTGVARGARWNRIPNYFQNAADELVLMIQLESIRGLEILDKVCAVPQVDVVFIGPADLAASMGSPGGERTEPVVAKVVAAIERIVHNGKTAGVMTLDERVFEQYQIAGARLIAVAVDTLILARETENQMTRFQSLI